jgi:RNA recognition motif-containing protein
MGRKLYVGNLTYGVTNSTLEQMFAAHGTVESAQVKIHDDPGGL